MIRALAALTVVGLATAGIAPASAAPDRLVDPVLDRMAGVWVLRGTIAGERTTHDLTGAWVLGYNYLQLHDVAREKDASGQPKYEAIVLLGKNPDNDGYACLWLDTTGGGGLSARAIGHGRFHGDEIEFLFVGSDGSRFHTTFLFGGDGTWLWEMDSEVQGKLQPFARVRLTRE